MSYKRIVSLTPSITETLFSLGCGDWLVGVTDACDFPAEANSKPHVYSWFDPSVDRIRALDPDLVLGLATAHSSLPPALLSHQIDCHLYNPLTIDDVLQDILKLGQLLGAATMAQKLLNNLQRRLDKLDIQVNEIVQDRKMTVSRVLDIDGDSLIVAGPLSFQYDVIKRAGGINVTSSCKAAYPKVSFQQFRKWDPELIFICGTDNTYLRRLHADANWQSLQALQNGNLYQFDCGLTCRTGPRIVDMAELLYQTLYP